MVIIAFDYFDQFINTHLQSLNYHLKEEEILEVALPPLLESNDHLGILNDLQDLTSK